MIPPPQWTTEQLEADRQKAIEQFRRDRIEEPLDLYLDALDRYLEHAEEFLEATVDLSRLREEAQAILMDSRLFEIFRYLAGPPISTDDLKTLVGASLAPSRLRENPDAVTAAVQIILNGLDRRRFPWVTEGRDPDEAERRAAVLATAAMAAMQRTSTSRRHLGKHHQENLVREALSTIGFKNVRRRRVNTFADAPQPGEYCGESPLATRRADFIVRLWDHRVMPIECKVSNSAVNSVKRLNNDAAAKAEVWKRQLGELQVVPVAILSGVYELHNLEDAQRRGLTIFWAHDLRPMLEWIEKTRP